MKTFVLILSLWIKTCPCGPVVKALGRQVQQTEQSMTHFVAGVQTLVHPPTKELFVMNPMHMMNREIIPGRKSGFDGDCESELMP